MPGWHRNPEPSQTLGGKDRIGGPWRRPPHLWAAHGPYLGLEAGSIHDLARELKPATLTGICSVDDSVSLFSTKFHDRVRKIQNVRGAPALIVDHIEGWPVGG